MRTVFEITEDGEIRGLYTDEVDLFALGTIVNVTKASNVEFSVDRQVWQVTTLDGQVVYEHKNREKAIAWEIENFGVNGAYYNS